MKFYLTVLALILGFTPAIAALTLPAQISDQMVLQREMNVPIWGWGKAGDTVTVAFANQTVKGAVNADGSWKVALAPLKASAENRVMTITVGSETTAIKDVVVGEVWVCSGQSNMGFSLGSTAGVSRDPKDQAIPDHNKKELETYFDPLIRLIKVPAIPSYNKELTNFEGAWRLADSVESKKRFTAVGYFFAKELRAELNVPVGLLSCAWGGVYAQAFIPSTQFMKDPELAEYYTRSLTNREEKIKNYDAKADDERYQKQKKAWDKKVAEAKKAGKKVEGRAPKKPKHPAETPYIPSTVYNGMINPLIPYAIRGFIWYQGEANSKSDTPDFTYDVYLRTLIDGLRDRWGQGDFPFYYCQLANFHIPLVKNSKSYSGPAVANGWPRTSNEMRTVLDHKNVGMAVLNDCGDALDIHPKNKMDPGKRLARWALAKDYGYDDLVYSGPLYVSHVIEGKKVKIQFDSVGDGLMVARKHLLDPAKPVNEELDGFQICGSDGTWKWAKAKISGTSGVTVWHDEITEPTAVRYAWASNPVRANLYNKAGLPTSIFSTK